MKNWVIAAILIVLAAAGYFYYDANKQAEPAAVVSSDIPDPVPEPEPKPSNEPDPVPSEQSSEQSTIGQLDPAITAETEMDEIPLPMLSESDPLVLENLNEMLGSPAVIRYVVSDNVISRIVATVDTLGTRQIPAVVQVINGPATAFAATPDSQPDRIISNEEGDSIPQFIINPATYERYTPYVELFEAVDSAQWVNLYRQYEPLLLEAYRQMGYSEGSFNERLLVIIDELLATPTASDPVHLNKPEAYYFFTDPELEALTAGQKIMLRMGSGNAARVKVKMEEIRKLL